MKRLTVTLTKGEHTATMTAIYEDASWPASTEWTGDRGAFRLASGALPTCLASVDRVPEVVAHQAMQSGASHAIAWSGSCPLRTDNIIEP